MNPSEEAIKAIRQMVTMAMSKNHEGLLTTVSATGFPHATWMGAFCTPDFQNLITVTGLHTDKVANVRANPNVEWMFTSPDRHTIVYLQGRAEIVNDAESKRLYTQLVPHETSAAFMNYFRAGGEWCAIKTHIENAIYCMPTAYMKIQIAGHQLSARH